MRLGGLHDNGTFRPHLNKNLTQVPCSRWQVINAPFGGGKWKKSNLQNESMEFGAITSLEAFVDLGETRLSGCIFQLKKKGVNISTQFKDVQNRWKEPRRVKEYRIG